MQTPVILPTQLPLILIVDDDLLTRTTVSAMLKNTHIVKGFESAVAAEEYLLSGEERPDLILLDICMPEVDGYTFFETLKKNLKTKEIPVIFLTGDDDAMTEARCIESGAFDFIKKPLLPSILRSRINRAIELTGLRRNLETEVEKQTELANKRLQEYKKFTGAIVNALALAIDAKERYTTGRTQRIAGYCTEIARRMRRTPEEITDIQYGALLHDIGKITLPDNLPARSLNASGSESKALEIHTTAGYEILQKIPELAKFAPAVLSHHENYDGSGYPQRLKGKQIPEVARILAVALAYETATSSKSYRRPLSQSDARALIQAGRGTRFDPDITDVMLEMIDEDKNYSMREPEKTKA